MPTPPLHHETIAHKSALTLHPRPAFFEWVAAVAPHHPLGWSVERLLAARETIAWIIPSCGSFSSGAALEAYLATFKPSLLASELRAAFPTEMQWPELSAASFDAFFELRLHPHVASIKHLTPTPPA